MLLFTSLTIIFVSLLGLTIAAISVGGVVFVIIFGDVIVCIFLIAWLMKILRRKK